MQHLLNTSAPRWIRRRQASCASNLLAQINGVMKPAWLEATISVSVEVTIAKLRNHCVTRAWRRVNARASADIKHNANDANVQTIMSDERIIVPDLTCSGVKQAVNYLKMASSCCMMKRSEPIFVELVTRGRVRFQQFLYLTQPAIYACLKKKITRSRSNTNQAATKPLTSRNACV